MAFESHSPNIANLQNYLNEENSKQKDFEGGPKWWSIPTGMSSVRILPPWDPTGRIALAVNMHPIEYQGPKMKYKKYNWTCTNRTLGKPCKICEGLQQLAAAGVDVSKYEATRRQFYMNAIVMHDPVYYASVQSGKSPENADGVAPGTHVLLKAPKTIYDWVISQITNPMVGDITSLTQGIDIYITKEGSGLNTKYTPTLCPNGRTPVPQEYLDKIESLYNLDEVFGSGFDEDLIKELFEHLKKSAGVIANNIPNVVSQMAGYPSPAPAMTPPTSGYPTPVPTVTTPVVPSPVQSGIPIQYTGTPSQSPIAPSPFLGASNPMNTPVDLRNIPGVPITPTPAPKPEPVVPSAPQYGAQVPNYGVPVTPAPAVTPAAATSSPMDMNLPKCFGQYNPQNVTCVVCPAEVNCSQKTMGR